MAGLGSGFRRGRRAIDNRKRRSNSATFKLTNEQYGCSICGINTKFYDTVDELNFHYMLQHPTINSKEKLDQLKSLQTSHTPMEVDLPPLLKLVDPSKQAVIEEEPPEPEEPEFMTPAELPPPQTFTSSVPPLVHPSLRGKIGLFISHSVSPGLPDLIPQKQTNFPEPVQQDVTTITRTATTAPPATAVHHEQEDVAPEGKGFWPIPKELGPGSVDVSSGMFALRPDEASFFDDTSSQIFYDERYKDPWRDVDVDSVFNSYGDDQDIFSQDFDRQYSTPSFFYHHHPENSPL